MKEDIAEKSAPIERGMARRSGAVCPSLVLAATIVCDRLGPLHDLSREQVRDYCTTELHSRCSRWSLRTAP